MERLATILVFVILGMANMEGRAMLGFTDQEKACIVDMYADGLSSRAIGNWFERSHQSALLVLRKAGVIRPKNLHHRGAAAEMFSQGMPCKRIASRLGISIITVYKHLHRSGIRQFNRMTAADKQAAVELYKQGLSCARIGSRLGFSWGGVRDCLARLGVARRPRIGFVRKYTLDESVFDDAESNYEAAYWTGLLMADGCLLNNKSKRGHSYCLSLSLKISDKSHLVKFGRFLKSNRPIYVKTKTTPYGNQCQGVLTVSSRRFHDSLAKYGVTPRKTWTAKVLLLEDSRDFWRGMVDGDGWVSFVNMGRHYYYAVIGLVGTRTICKQFAMYIKSLVGYCPRVEPMGSIWRTKVSGKKASLVIAELYENNVVCLDRKMRRAKLAAVGMCI